MKKLFIKSLFFILLFACLVPISKIYAADDFWDRKMNLSLSYLPKNPINNPENPVELTISALASGTNTNTDNIKYTWRVYGSTKKNNPADWEEILKKDLVDVSNMSGFGINKLKFKLAFKDASLRFIRIKLNATEINSKGDNIEGEADITIPLTSISGDLSVYSIYATDAGLEFGKSLCENMITDSSCSEKDNISGSASAACQNKTTDLFCPVIKNDIVGLKLDDSKLSDVTWKLDGEPLSYGLCPLDDCESNKAVFPILKDPQETYLLEASATVKATGRRATLSKKFIVIEPSASIESMDKTTAAPILLGYFKDLDENLTPDYSSTNFEAVAGSNIRLNPNFKVQNINDITWTIDISPVTKSTAEKYGLLIKGKEQGVTIDDDGSISFPSDTEIGYSYDVTFSTLYTPANSIKKALNKYWGVGINDFYEKQIDDTINITVVDAISGSVYAPEDSHSSKESTKNKTLAALVASAPSQLIFLVKIVLISFVLLFSSYFIFSLFPKTKK